MKLLGKARGEAREGEAIRELLKNADLPSLPSVVATAIGQLGQTDVNIGDVADTVAQDAGLSLQLLKTVNSLTFAPRTPIDTVRHAVIMLGRNALESLLFSFGVVRALPNDPTPGFDSTDFWTTAAFRAGVAAGITELLDPSATSRNFTAALLQDMALPLLASKVERYPAIVAAKRGSERLHEIETATFGWDHSQVGAWMAEEWGFPESLTSGIAFHHGGDGDSSSVMRAVAEIRGTNEGQAMDSVLAAIEHWCGVSREQAEMIVEDGLERARTIASLLL